MDSSILAPFAPIGGNVGFYFEDLTTGETLIQNGDMPLKAASVIKLTVMAEAFRRLEAGSASRDECFAVRAEDKLPGCGALSVMHSGLKVTFMDLIWLMIVFSDNSATNMLIKRLGMDAINENIENLGIVGTHLNRLLYDSEASSRGVQNTVSAAGMGKLLRLIYKGELVSGEASAEMMEILLGQQLTGKLPLSLPREVEIAHKTGEDDGITHDVGIVEAAHPYIICILSNNVCEPDFDMAIHRVSRDVYDYIEAQAAAEA